MAFVQGAVRGAPLKQRHRALKERHRSLKARVRGAEAEGLRAHWRARSRTETKGLIAIKLAGLILLALLGALVGTAPRTGAF